VTLSIRDEGGAELLRRTLPATPVVRYPNREGCAPKIVQLHMEIAKVTAPDEG
jgi:hypothetical protein